MKMYTFMSIDCGFNMWTLGDKLFATKDEAEKALDHAIKNQVIHEDDREFNYNHSTDYMVEVDFATKDIKIVDY